MLQFNEFWQRRWQFGSSPGRINRRLKVRSTQHVQRHGELKEHEVHCGRGLSQEKHAVWVDKAGEKSTGKIRLAHARDRKLVYSAEFSHCHSLWVIFVCKTLTPNSKTSLSLSLWNSLILPISFSLLMPGGHGAMPYPKSRGWCCFPSANASYCTNPHIASRVLEVQSFILEDVDMDISCIWDHCSQAVIRTTFKSYEKGQGICNINTSTLKGRRHAKHNESWETNWPWFSYSIHM